MNFFIYRKGVLSSIHYVHHVSTVVSWYYVKRAYVFTWLLCNLKPGFTQERVPVFYIMHKPACIIYLLCLTYLGSAVTPLSASRCFCNYVLR
jgi:hypothetical protein